MLMQTQFHSNAPSTCPEIQIGWHSEHIMVSFLITEYGLRIQTPHTLMHLATSLMIVMLMQ
jgi:hypothetical protein